MDDELFQLFDENVISNIPSTNPDNEYWLVRAESGAYFQDFYQNEFIAIGWNEISAEDVSNNLYNSNIIRSKLISIKKLANNTKNKRRMGSASKQMIRFQDEIREGNIVMVPSENSEQFAVGIVTSEVYTEESEERLSLGHCPYVKRRKVSWYGVFARNNFDSTLRNIIFAAHTISNITRYKGFINRVVFDTYIEGDDMHMTFNTKQDDAVDLDTLTDFLSAYKNISNLLNPNEKIKIKINLQSPGPVEIIGSVVAIGTVAGLIWNYSPSASTIKASLKKHIERGGKATVGKVSIELPNIAAEEQQQKNEERRLEMEEKRNNAEIEKIKVENEKTEIENERNRLKLQEETLNFYSNLERLQGTLPEEYSKALKLSQESKETKRTLQRRIPTIN